MTRWYSISLDKTELELMRFDFKTNPKLRFELYDQSEDDGHPFNDDASYFERGVGDVVRHLNRTGKGPVVAAWNGLFFSFTGGRERHASHIGPVVIAGKAHFNVGNARWAFGVSYRSGRPIFNVVHEPGIKAMEKEFDYGSVGAQYLLKEGRPLRLQAFPRPGDPPLKQPVSSTDKDVGHIPRVDFLRTSRTSMAWSRDDRYLYLLVVNAPETETESWLALERGAPVGGWALADLQNFWSSFGAWGAVNSDGGILTQFAYELPDGRYALLPSRQASPNERLILDHNLTGAPTGGSLMTFYVKDMRK